MKSLCDAILHFFDAGSPVALVTMMDQCGSVPRSAGARMLVLPDGSIRGTVGGGRYEAEAIGLAMELLRRRQEQEGTTGRRLCAGAILEYSLLGVSDMDMICGGALSLLLETPDPEAMQAMFMAAREAETSGRPFLFITRFSRQESKAVVDSDSPNTPEAKLRVEKGERCAATVERFLYLPDSGRVMPEGARVPENILAQARALNSATPHHCMHEGREYLLELFPPPFRINLFGGGHVSREVACLAQGVDFSVTVLDDRPEFANSERFPGAQVLTPPSLSEHDCAASLDALRIGPRDAIVIVTRGHAHDREALAAALATDAGYIGMIGSRSKRQAVYASLKQQGIPQERLNLVRSPIGLAIGADTPREIAVSIVGELILWRKNTRDAEAGKAQPGHPASLFRNGKGGPA